MSWEEGVKSESSKNSQGEKSHYLLVQLREFPKSWGETRREGEFEDVRRGEAIWEKQVFPGGDEPESDMQLGDWGKESWLFLRRRKKQRRDCVKSLWHLKLERRELIQRCFWGQGRRAEKTQWRGSGLHGTVNGGSHIRPRTVGWMVMGWRMLARHGAWELKIMEAEYFHRFKWYLGWGRGSLEWGQHWKLQDLRRPKVRGPLLSDGRQGYVRYWSLPGTTPRRVDEDGDRDKLRAV